MRTVVVVRREFELRFFSVLSLARVREDSCYPSFIEARPSRDRRGRLILSDSARDTQITETDSAG